LTDEQRAKVVQFLTAGAGRASVCEQVGISLRVLCSAIVAEPTFREQVETAEEARINDCELILYDQAMGGSAAAAMAFIKLKRDHRADEARLKNETRVADAYAGTSSVSMSNLSNDEFTRFRTLHGHLEAGMRLEDGEVREYVALMQMMVMSPASGQGDQGGLSAPAYRGPASIQDAERLFGVDDNQAG
jgi:hypothetical protein